MLAAPLLLLHRPSLIQVVRALRAVEIVDRGTCQVALRDKPPTARHSGARNVVLAQPHHLAPAAAYGAAGPIRPSTESALLLRRVPARVGTVLKTRARLGLLQSPRPAVAALGIAGDAGDDLTLPLPHTRAIAVATAPIGPLREHAIDVRIARELLVARHLCGCQALRGRATPVGLHGYSPAVPAKATETTLGANGPLVPFTPLAVDADNDMTGLLSARHNLLSVRRSATGASDGGILGNGPDA
mmetsp:Transcript_11410/g.40487  ORF Transcript_11410/g.40487 Transcript_11410/m.40487 type:complete len:244 (+) Transcript_11410:3240-3971(+)